MNIEGVIHNREINDINVDNNIKNSGLYRDLTKIKEVKYTIFPNETIVEFTYNNVNKKDPNLNGMLVESTADNDGFVFMFGWYVLNKYVILSIVLKPDMINNTWYVTQNEFINGCPYMEKDAEIIKTIMVREMFINMSCLLQKEKQFYKMEKLSPLIQAVINAVSFGKTESVSKIFRGNVDNAFLMGVKNAYVK